MKYFKLFLDHSNSDTFQVVGRYSNDLKEFKEKYKEIKFSKRNVESLKKYLNNFFISNNMVPCDPGMRGCSTSDGYRTVNNVSIYVSFYKDENKYDYNWIANLYVQRYEDDMFLIHISLHPIANSLNKEVKDDEFVICDSYEGITSFIEKYFFKFNPKRQLSLNLD